MMKHKANDISTIDYNLEEMCKAIKMEKLANLFVYTEEGKDGKLLAYLKDANLAMDGKNVITIDTKNQTYDFNGETGGVLELFHLLTRNADFFIFAKSVFHVDCDNYIEKITFNDGAEITFDHYPMNLDEVICG